MVYARVKVGYARLDDVYARVRLSYARLGVGNVRVRPLYAHLVCWWRYFASRVIFFVMAYLISR
ncbi:hypothetical protein NCCP2222_29940 [Sporosarcina sp. NCCP-2222]|nr:hypothetical protein NCCP2222_29940 [Sporosarcina sp. NCCP-2222]